MNNASGKLCTYAHQIDELQVRECMFKNKCNFVSCGEGSRYTTKDRTICMYSHPDETVDNYVYRVIEPRRGVVVNKTLVPKKEYVIPAPIPENKEKSWADVMCDDEVAAEDEEGEVSIETSKEDLVKILNVMIAKGKKNFKIKITN